MANLSGNLTGLSLFFGLLSAVDTMAPQAFGAGRVSEVGTLCMRGFLLCMIATVPAFMLWWRMEELLLLVGQPAEVARLAGRFLKIYCFAVPPLLFVEVLRRFYQCQNIVKPFVWIIMVVSGVAHPIFLRFWHHMLGFDGIAMAVASSLWLNATISILHVKYNQPATSPPSARWVWWFDGVAAPASLSRISVADALEWKQVVVFLKLGLPGILGMSEWWMWEAFAFMAGRLGTKALAAHSVAYNYIPLVFMMPIGVAIGQSVRVATLLGKGEVESAKQVAKWSTGVCLGVLFVIVFIMYCARDRLIRPFTTDAEVHELTKDIWGHMCIFIIFDSTYGMLRGTIIGLGLQSKMGMAIFVALWCIGLPIIYHSTFGAGNGLVGLWSSLPIGYGLLDVLLLLAILTADWTFISDRIQAAEIGRT